MDLPDDGDLGRQSLDETVRPEKAQARAQALDLPTSLDDRRPGLEYAGAETEMYDGWLGQSQYLSSSALPSLRFDLAIDGGDPAEEAALKSPTSPRFQEMLAARAAHTNGDVEKVDEQSIINNDNFTQAQKKQALQKLLTNAASNGDADLVKRLLHGPGKEYVEVNGVDDEGSAPIIYASCFGHEDVVTILLETGAQVDKQDKNLWTPLMWALTNRQKEIVKVLLDKGASMHLKSTSGRTAADFAAPNTEMGDFLSKLGYQIGGEASLGADFYDSGLAQDRFEQELEENEMRRRMMMESSINLEVDLASLGMDEHPESPDDAEEQQDFVWDRCLNDQMFVFQEAELEAILNIVITGMVPQRTATQKPVPANVLFLAARYAHYHGTEDLLALLLRSATERINEKVARHQWDMTILAFWISNATLLLHYLQKDTGLVSATAEFQVQLVELINEIFVFIVRDAERRLDRILRLSILDHETIPFDHLEFVGEWNLFKSKNKPTSNALDSSGHLRAQQPSKQAVLSPRSVTSLLSSTLFVLDLYDVHSVITAQIVSQLCYWIGAELFNHIVSNKIYLARTKAMQIRMNLSVLEDWARTNNRAPEHYDAGSLSKSGETTVEAARKHLAPVIQLLQWLQCFSSLNYENKDSPDSLENTLSQLSLLSAHQLLQTVAYYRYEKEEKMMPKSARRKLQDMQTEAHRRWLESRQSQQAIASNPPPSVATQSELSSIKSSTKSDQITTSSKSDDTQALQESTPSKENIIAKEENPIVDNVSPAQRLQIDPSHMLKFSLPTTVDLRLSYGAGYGGVNREREKRYIPTVPPEFLVKLDSMDSSSAIK